MVQVVHKVGPAVVRERMRATPEEIAVFCRAHHISWLALFGSALRDDFTDDSDVDVLVEFDPEHMPDRRDTANLVDELSVLFAGRTVDLVNRAVLYWRMRDRILRSMVVQYGDAPEIPAATAPEISTTKDDRVYVGIMWDMARKIGGSVQGEAWAEYRENKTLRDALAAMLRRFSARSAQVSPAYREAHAEIAWQKTDGMYRAVSEEDGIALTDETLWKIATREIPALVPMLESLLPPEMRDPPDELPRGMNG